jgi:hypothetical protein
MLHLSIVKMASSVKQIHGNPQDAPDLSVAKSRVCDVIPLISPHHTPPSPRRPAPVPQESVSAITPPTIPCHNPTSTPPDPRPPPFHKPLPAAASEPRNRHVMPGSRKHQQERSITNRSGQQSGRDCGWR